MAIVTQEENGVENMVFWLTQKNYAKIWRYNRFISMKAMLREGENIYHSHMHNVPKDIKLININHAISLLQMQECPQSNIKQEIKSFLFQKCH